MAEQKFLRRDPKTGKFPAFKLSTGEVNRVVVVTGKPSPTITVPGTRFAYNSAFPTPAIAGALRFMIEAMDESPTHRATVFGHADSTGSAQFNKLLSDRRAKALLAVLTDDPGAFGEVADAEAWPISMYQAMMRALGPNPGAIDGATGPLTERAVRGFQREYARKVYHREAGRGPVVEIEETGQLDADTKIAIRDGYLALFSTRIPASRFAGPRFAGCSEFIPLQSVADATNNRRVTLAVFREADLPRKRDFPCVEGDAAACPLDRADGRRCPFYRERVNEPTEPEFAGDEIPFFDFQWLRGSDTVTHLSVITSLPDDTAITFRVRRADKGVDDLQLPLSSNTGKPPQVGPELISIQGQVKNGVAFAKWEHPANEDPFDFDKWFIDFDENIIGDGETGATSTKSARDFFDAPGMTPPLFEVEADGQWGLSAPPGHALNRVELSSDGGVGVAITSSGFIVNFKATPGIVDAVDDALVLSLLTRRADPPDAASDADDSRSA